MKKAKIQKYQFETSVLRKRIWGDDEERTDIKRIIDNGSIYTSSYCIKEILVGVIKTLVSFYFQIDSAKDTDEAINSLNNASFGPRVPKLMNDILRSIGKSFNNTKEHDQSILLVYIQNILEMCKTYPIICALDEGHNCCLAKLSPGYTYNEMLNFYNKLDEWSKKNACPNCKINAFFAKKDESIQKIVNGDEKGKQSEYKRIHKLPPKISTIDNCKLCSTMGDLIISVDNNKQTMVTYDKTIKEFCFDIERECILLENHSAKKFHLNIKKAKANLSKQS